MTTHEGEGTGRVAVGGEQRLLQQGAEGGAAFLRDDRLGLFAEPGEAGAPGVGPG